MAKMSKIPVYTLKPVPNLRDRVLIVDTEDFDRTKSLELEGIVGVINSLNGSEVISYIFTDGTDEELSAEIPGYFTSAENEVDLSSITQFNLNLSLATNLSLSQLFYVLSNNTNLFVLKIRNTSNPNEFAYFTISSATFGETTVSFALQVLGDLSNGSIQNEHVYVFDFVYVQEVDIPTPTTPPSGYRRDFPYSDGNPQSITVPLVEITGVYHNGRWLFTSEFIITDDVVTFTEIVLVDGDVISIQGNQTY